MINVGKWAFIIGIILAIVAGFFAVPYLTFILLVLGLVVGFLNIGHKNAHDYLVAAIALLLIGIASVQSLSVLNIALADWVQTVLANFIAFVAASALVVAIKAVVKLGQE